MKTEENPKSDPRSRKSNQPSGGGKRKGLCPSPEQLWQAAHDGLPAQQKARVLGHLASCPTCKEDWRMAMQIARGGGPGLPSIIPRASQAPRKRKRYLFAGMVAAFLAVVISMPALRSRDPGASLRSLLISSPSIPREDFELIWQLDAEGADQATFEVEVTTEDLVAIDLASDLSSNRYSVPEWRLEELEFGAQLQWQVRAFLPDGREFASETFECRLR